MVDCILNGTSHKVIVQLSYNKDHTNEVLENVSSYTCILSLTIELFGMINLKVLKIVLNSCFICTFQRTAGLSEIEGSFADNHLVCSFKRKDSVPELQDKVFPLTHSKPYYLILPFGPANNTGTVKSVTSCFKCTM